MCPRLPCRFFARVNLAQIGLLHIFSCGLLDELCKLAELRTLMLVSRHHFHRQQMPQGIHRKVDLATFAVLVTITAALGEE